MPSFMHRKNGKTEKDLKTIAEGRGRKLKCEDFPELTRYIEYCFGEGDRVLRGGGGLEADPRLLDTKLFKAADNATVMRHVKEMLNTIKPEFVVSTLTRTITRKTLFKQNATTTERTLMPMCHSTKL